MVRTCIAMLAACSLAACDFDKAPQREPATVMQSSRPGPDPSAAAGQEALPAAGAGAGMSMPCMAPNGCPPALPYCSVEQNVCVECLQDGACGEERPRCEPQAQKCVQCLGDEDCSGSTVKCDLASHTCAECLVSLDCKDPELPSCRAGECGSCEENSDCARFPARKLCGTRASSSPGACVECLQHSDCEDPKKPQCSAGVCEPCGGQAADKACEGHRGATVCQTAEGASKGTCVQCTIKNEAACGDFVCDGTKNVCSKELKGSADSCEPCIADTQCVTDHRCVPVEFKNKPHGDYCLKRESTGCTEPFRVRLGAQSLSRGRSENYCGINTEVTTCEAVRALISNADCKDDDDCGAKMGDGLCRTVVGSEDKCTYACSVDLHCPPTITCNGGACQ